MLPISPYKLNNINYLKNSPTIAQTASKIYNRSRCSLTFSQQRNVRIMNSDDFKNDIEIDCKNSFIPISKVADMLESLLASDEKNFSKNILKFKCALQQNFDEKTLQSINDIKFLNSLDFCLHEDCDKNHLSNILKTYRQK